MLEPPPGMEERWHQRHESLKLRQVGWALDTPLDTVFRWFQLIQASRPDFGMKDGKAWTFDVHELYVFLLIASFYRAGIPVGPTQIRAICAFAYDSAGKPVKPTGRLVQAGPLTEFRVEADRIYEAARFAMNDEVPQCFRN